MRLWDVERHAARRGPRLKGARRDPTYARFNGPGVFSSAARIAWLSGQLWLAVLSSRTSAKNVRVLNSSANDAARSVSECGQPRRTVTHFFMRVTQMSKRKFGLLVGAFGYRAQAFLEVHQ